MNSSGTASPDCIDETRFQSLCFMVDFILVEIQPYFAKVLKYTVQHVFLHEHHGKLEAMLGAGAAVP